MAGKRTWVVGVFRYWEARRKNKLPAGIGLASGVCERETISYYSYDPAQFFDLCGRQGHTYSTRINGESGECKD